MPTCLQHCHAQRWPLAALHFDYNTAIQRHSSSAVEQKASTSATFYIFFLYLCIRSTNYTTLLRVGIHNVILLKINNIFYVSLIRFLWPTFYDNSIIYHWHNVNELMFLYWFVRRWFAHWKHSLLTLKSNVCRNLHATHKSYRRHKKGAMHFRNYNYIIYWGNHMQSQSCLFICIDSWQLCKQHFTNKAINRKKLSNKKIYRKLVTLLTELFCLCFFEILVLFIFHFVFSKFSMK